MIRLTRAFAVLLAAAALCAPFAARADYPERLVRIVVPYPAGGGMDAVTRTIAAKLTDNLGKPVVVENRAGGGGMVGIQAMTNAPADGYTLMTHALGFAVNPSIYRKLPYDAVGNIQPVAIVGFSPVYIAINPKLPAKNLQEFVELAKKRRMRGATFGFGASRLMIEELRFKGGFDVDFIPYNGAAPAIIATIAGDTDFVMMDAPSLQQHIAAGKLRGLAVASEQRAPGLPDLPTTREAGMPGLVVDFWYAMFTRPGTPPEVLRKLNAEINKVTSAPDVAQRMNAIGIVPNHLGLAESTRFYLAEVDRWKGVVQKAKIEPVDQ
jgi:tripartite-type tricarboxylate transporter receptor subunit TctC